MHFAHPSGSISRRQLSVFLAGTLCAGAAVAQSESGFPSKTVRLVVIGVLAFRWIVNRMPVFHPMKESAPHP